MDDTVQARITIAKLIEAAYSKDEGLTVKIVRSYEDFRLAVDENGNATLSGGAGMIRFNSDNAISSFGAKVKNISVTFSTGENDNVNYTAVISFQKVAGIMVVGSFNILQLITSCSGLLCRAARALTGGSAHDMQLRRVMGGY